MRRNGWAGQHSDWDSVTVLSSLWVCVMFVGDCGGLIRLCFFELAHYLVCVFVVGCLSGR